jgi:hypothetical protein
MKIAVVIAAGEPGLAEDLQGVATEVRLDASGDDPVLEANGAPVDPEVLATHRAVAIRRGGDEARLDRLNNRLSILGLPRLSVIEAGEGPVDLAMLVGALLEALQREAGRHVALRDEASEVRALYEARTQERLNLVRYLFRHGLATRTNTLTLSPAPALSPLALASGVTVEQRLPVKSTGLSDVAIFLPNQQDGDGVLDVALRTLEGGDTVARWRVDRRQAGQGWARFALAESLGSQDMSPLLSVRWEGAETVSLGLAMKHPDARMQAVMKGAPAGAVLACRAWSYVEGSEAPVAQGSILPDADGPDSFYLPSDVLASVRSLNTIREKCIYRGRMNAVQVHVLADRVAIGLLEEAVPEGVHHICARALTRSAEGPVAEYAIGIASPADRPAAPDVMPDFKVQHVTPWLALSPKEEGSLDLALPKPTTEPQDLYLMTRLYGSNKSIVHGWTTFDRIFLATAAR